jgi:hypothetical protein
VLVSTVEPIYGLGSTWESPSLRPTRTSFQPVNIFSPHSFDQSFGRPAMHLSNALLVAALLGSSALAHPGHDVAKEAAERRHALRNTKPNLQHCNKKLKARGVEQRTIDRRAALLRSEREKRGLTGSK